MYAQKDLKWQQKEHINRQKHAVFARMAFARVWQPRAVATF
jgi:hypothetical protein